MEEVITCWCKNQEWVIGTSGIRCTKCGRWLPKRFSTVNVRDANIYISSRTEAGLIPEVTANPGA